MINPGPGGRTWTCLWCEAFLYTVLDLRAIRGRSIMIPGLMLGTHIRFTRPQTHPRRWPPQPAATLIELILVPCVVGGARFGTSVESATSCSPILGGQRHVP